MTDPTPTPTTTTDGPVPRPDLPLPAMHPVVAEVTERLVERSTASRAAYLRRVRAGVAAGAANGAARADLGCANLAHGFAAAEPREKSGLRGRTKPNVAVVTSYNDMLSAHQPYGSYPPVLKEAVIRAGGIAQVAGGVPAMCDGITQGRDGMQLSLYSRDVIAMSTAIALSHDMFDAALMLGVCDKITPGLLIGALSFGHLPTVFVPAGPMTSGLPNKEKAAVRQRYAEGLVGREELLEAESASYHSRGTCTFYGTANSNQLLMEVLGLHLPGSSFENPDSPLREPLTRAAAARAVALSVQGAAKRDAAPTPIGELVDEKAVVNACVALLASGGSTNHTMHLVAIARAAGIALTWDDFSDLSAVVPLLSRMYPNGSADVNHFHAAGGIGFLVRTLLGSGLLHEDVETVVGRGLARYTCEPELGADGTLSWREGATASLDTDVLRPVEAPFSPDGGLRMLRGPLGRAVVKVSAVAEEHRVVTAPAMVFDHQDDLLTAFDEGRLDGRDLVAVVRYQGPAANGMPELHKLTPALGVLQDRGQRVAIVTDGRMSGASGKVPAAIHVTPEAALGGPLARVRDGDVVTLDADAGTLSVATEDDFDARESTGRPPQGEEWAGTGRELFAAFRATVGPADEGASVFAAVDATPTLQEVRVDQHA
ncbi:phosphogluconate dehydratase [Nocardioides sp. AX2bis]|uniref:phosphogluconate dehydratase n=1 Tax=Nocardioides sp. AX2bis TaxID=2653157 RepID=UPI0012EF47BA|nr:phosphogluconate dehydratase [Nocardioides sp. AX2bis]VXC59214.1 6-phosphogluconate dehydratase [Nocardioides sp. AX2bis]